MCQGALHISQSEMGMSSVTGLCSPRYVSPSIISCARIASFWYVGVFLHSLFTDFILRYAFPVLLFWKLYTLRTQSTSRLSDYQEKKQLNSSV